MKVLILFIFLIINSTWPSGDIKDVLDQIGQGSLIVQVATIFKGHQVDSFNNGNYKVEFTHNNLKAGLVLPIEEYAPRKESLIKD